MIEMGRNFAGQEFRFMPELEFLLKVCSQVETSWKEVVNDIPVE